MIDRQNQCGRETFEAKYADCRDPWNFAGSPYERGRFDEIIGALGRAHYERAFEPGCSIGELTALLAPRCSSLLATDIAPTAVGRAADRCAPFPHVQILCQDLAAQFPAGRFDLIVFSEIGYYFEDDALTALARRLAEHLSPRGELLAAHWLGTSEDHVLHGGEVHEILRRTLEFPGIIQRRGPDFLVERWQRA